MPVELRKVETLYQGYSTILQGYTLAAPDGSLFTREIEHHGRGAAVLPDDPERRAVTAGQPAPRAGDLGRRPAGAGRGAGRHDRERRLRGHRPPRGHGGGRRPAWPPGADRRALHLARRLRRAHRPLPSGLFGEGPHRVGRRRRGRAGEHHRHGGPSSTSCGPGSSSRRIEDLKTLALILALRVRRPELF